MRAATELQDEQQDQTEEEEAIAKFQGKEQEQYHSLMRRIVFNPNNHFYVAWKFCVVLFGGFEFLAYPFIVAWGIREDYQGPIQ